MDSGKLESEDVLNNNNTKEETNYIFNINSKESSVQIGEKNTIMSEIPEEGSSNRMAKLENSILTKMKIYLATKMRKSQRNFEQKIRLEIERLGKKRGRQRVKTVIVVMKRRERRKWKVVKMKRRVVQMKMKKRRGQVRRRKVEKMKKRKRQLWR